MLIQFKNTKKDYKQPNHAEDAWSMICLILSYAQCTHVSYAIRGGKSQTNLHQEKEMVKLKIKKK